MAIIAVAGLALADIVAQYQWPAYSAILHHPLRTVLGLVFGG